MSSSPISITPMLSVQDAAGAIAFYQKAFGAVEVVRLNDEQGKVSHAELRIGAAAVMLADEYPEIGAVSPETVGGSPVLLLLELPDVDAAFARAVAAGATVTRPIAGDTLRNGKLKDPYGHLWMLLTRQTPT